MIWEHVAESFPNWLLQKVFLVKKIVYKGEYVMYREMDTTGHHHPKRNQTDSERHTGHVFSRLWVLTPERYIKLHMCIEHDRSEIVCGNQWR